MTTIANRNMSGTNILDIDGLQVAATLYPDYWFLQVVTSGITISKKYPIGTCNMRERFLDEIRDTLWELN